MTLGGTTLLKKTSSATGEKSETPGDNAACEQLGVWVKRYSLPISEPVQDMTFSTNYSSLSANPVEIDLSLNPLTSSIAPAENRSANSDSSNLAITDLRSQCLRMDQELRTLHLEIVSLRREIRALRIQRVGSR